MTSRITAVLFDLGDTLWHFPNMPPHEAIRQETIRRLSDLLRSWGVDPDRFYFLGRDIRIAVEEETERAARGDWVSPHYPSLCRDVAARLGLRLNDGQAEELWEAWNLGGQFLGRQLYPDVIDTLHWLRDCGYRLGSVTNRGYGGPRFRQEMQDLGLADLFEVVAISCHVGYLKPHPRIFQYALEAMDISPQETAMVGDNLFADIGGARALGMTAIWRRPPLRQAQGRPLDEPVETATDRPQDAGAPTSGEIAPDYTIDDISDLKRLPLFDSRQALPGAG